jgi:hypothetical protein
MLRGWGGGGMITLDMYYDGLMRRAVICTDVIQSPNHIDPALDLNLWCTQWKVTAVVLFHILAVVGLLTVFHSQKEDELEPETHILRDRRPSTTACPACWRWAKRN